MSIFNLHSDVLADYRDFVCSFFSVADDRARRLVLEAWDRLEQMGRAWDAETRRQLA